MNNRTVELYKQALDTAYKEVNKLKNPAPELAAQAVCAEKFAELIIKECMDAVDPPSDKFKDREESDACWKSRNAIRKHFGMK
jgi:hypothetical protein